jgi:VanZ family protein
MPSQERWIEPRLAIIATGVVGIIVYGSLYPFEFYDNPDVHGPVRDLLATWRTPSNRDDAIANILLYIPFGFFSVQSVRRLRTFILVLLVVFAGTALSVALELTQLYDLGRYSTLADVYANTAGTLLGASAGGILRQEFSLMLAVGRPFVVLLLACWFGYQLFPYLPVIGLNKYLTTIKPAVSAAALSRLDLYRHTINGLSIALMLEALFGRARSRLAILLLVPAVLFARILIIGTVLSAAEVVGGVLAVVVWCALLSELQIRAILVASAFAGVFVIQSLKQFRFGVTARAFGWIPFRSLMEGPLDVSIPSFFEKVFTYGTLIWLINRAGWSLSIATGLGGSLVLCMGLAQVNLPGQSAEITDLIILLILAVFIKLIAEDE